MTDNIKLNKILLLSLPAALLAGWLSAWLLLAPGVGHEQDSTPGEREPLYWVAPMDPNFRRDKPGKSPMGMDLIPVYAEDAQQHDQPGTVRISPQVVQNLGVRTAAVKRGRLDKQIRTVGYISFAEDRLTHFHSRVDGWIERLSVTAVGDPVKKGQPLFDMYSPKLVTAGEEYIAALASGKETLVDAAARKLQALGLQPSQIEDLKDTRQAPQRQTFFADQDGYIVELNVREGMFIQPATTVLSTGGLDTVWVIAEVFESQAAWIASGQAVAMTLASYPGQNWAGEIDYVYPVVNPQTRTVQARIRFDNADHRLKPHMFAELLIHAGYRDRTLSVPRAAVIRDGRMSRVVKALGAGNFVSTRIETGIEAGDLIEVTGGLQAGDEVVISAQFLLDSESSVGADLSRLENDRDRDMQGHRHD